MTAFYPDSAECCLPFIETLLCRKFTVIVAGAAFAQNNGFLFACSKNIFIGFYQFETERFFLGAHLNGALSLMKQLALFSVKVGDFLCP